VTTLTEVKEKVMLEGKKELLELSDEELKSVEGGQTGGGGGGGAGGNSVAVVVANTIAQLIFARFRFRFD
jgi:bacteriocin-like protein